MSNPILGVALRHLDALIDAMQRGAPESEIARLQQVAEQSEAKAWAHVGAWCRLVGVDPGDALPGPIDPDREDPIPGLEDPPTAYGPAIHRWELILGRPAPAPTVTGQRGGQQLSAHFVEWLMGLPEGWVTDVPGLSRNDMLRILGNGVVPAQAELALRLLLSAQEAAA